MSTRSLLASPMILVTALVPRASAQDSSFAAMQRRGKTAMGVDQYTSAHRFDDLADGGRIELQRDRVDPKGIRMIREHLQSIAKAFSTGDFSTPAFVHMRDVPGTKVMAARRALIRYRYETRRAAASCASRRRTPWRARPFISFSRSSETTIMPRGHTVHGTPHHQ